jgi:thymidylate kinase
LYDWLARIEGRLYTEIPPPDIVLQLKVSLETAVTRNRERNANKEQDADIASRHQQSGGWSLPGVQHVYDIDANQSLAETILRAKKLIWELI